MQPTRPFGPVFAVLGLLLTATVATRCSPTQQTAANNTIAAGQLFCAKAQAAGPLVVALADAAGAPIIVTGQAAGTVAAACAAIGAIPVTPPADPASAPVVAAPVVVVPVKAVS